MKLWVDDLRPKPIDYDTTAATVDDAINILRTGEVTDISLDHDLGEGGEAYAIARWIEQAAYNKEIPRLKWAIHTDNPVGRKNMEMALRNADKYWDDQELEEHFDLCLV